MRETKRAVVVGAGTMGHGIAQVLAMADVETTLVDVQQDFVDRGLERVKANLDKGVDKGKVEAAARDAALAPKAAALPAMACISGPP